MGCKQRQRLAVVGLVVVLLAGQAGCQDQVNEGKQGCVMSRNQSTAGDERRQIDYLNSFVKNCQLTPADTYMVPLPDFIRASDLTGRTSAEVKQMLADYRQTNGENPQFLTYNPALSPDVMDYSEARLVYLEAYLDDYKMNQVLIDLQEDSARSASSEDSILISKDLGTETELSAQQESGIISLLSQHAASWHQDDPRPPQPDWVATDYPFWVVALCADDGTLYRLQNPAGFGYSEAPPGFQDFLTELFDTIGFQPGDQGMR